MKLSSSLAAAALASLAAVAIAPHPASAFEVSRQSTLTDLEFNALIANGDFTETFVAEGRIGDRGSAATYELSVNTPISPGVGATPAVQAQYNWISGQTYNFKLQYDGTAVKYSLFNGSTWTNISTSDARVLGPANAIYFRTRETSSSNAKLDNLKLNGSALGAYTAPETGDADGVDYLVLKGLGSSFELTGDVLLSWTGTAPKNSALAYQIKVGRVKENKRVPEPATLLGLVAIATAGLATKRRRPVV